MRLLLVFSILLMVSCASEPPETFEHVLATRPISQIRAYAREQAAMDVGWGRTQICWVGPKGAEYAIGVPESWLPHAKQLPHYPLPKATTESLAIRSTQFARSYNEEVLRLLRQRG